MTTRQIYVALKAFVAEFAGAEPDRIVRGGNNRAPLPADPCVVLTVAEDTPLSTVGHRYDPIKGETTTTRLMQTLVKIECCGETAEDWARKLSLYLRDGEGCRLLAPYGLQPLYPGEPQDATAVTGENQFLCRWLVEAYVVYADEDTRSAEFFHSVRQELYAV